MRGPMYLTQQFSFNPSGMFLFLGTSVATDTVYFIYEDDLDQVVMMEICFS